MCDSRLKRLAARNCGFMWIRHHIYQSDSIKSDHFLEIDEASFIPVHIVDRETIICSVPVGFEEIAPERLWGLRHRHMQEDRIGGGFKDSICLESRSSVS